MTNFNQDTNIMTEFFFIGEGEFIDLEKTFKKQFDNLDSDLLEVI